MAESKKNSSRCLAVRSGRNTRYLGATSETTVRSGRNTRYLRATPQTNETTCSEQNDQLDVVSTTNILDLDMMGLKTIFKNLCSSELVNMFKLHPNFEIAATDVYKSIWRNGQTTTLQICLSSKPKNHKRLELNYKLLNSLGMCTTTLHIVGYKDEQVNVNNFRFFCDIIRLCPVVTNLKLVRCNIPAIFQFIKQLRRVTSVHFFYSCIDHVSLLPNVTDFKGNVSPSEVCELCNRHDSTISQSHILDFLNVNRQLRTVILHANHPPFCFKKCDVEKSNLIEKVRKILEPRLRHMRFCQIFKNDRIVLSLI